MLIRPNLALYVNKSHVTIISRSRFLLALLFSIIFTLVSIQPAMSHHYFFPRVRNWIQLQVETELNQKGFKCQGEIICGLKIIPHFYRQRNYEPAWFDRNGLRPTAESLLRALREAYKDGLNPLDYHLKTIERLWIITAQEPFPPMPSKAKQWADLDLILTDAYLLLGSHLAGGRINPENLHADWIISPHSWDMLEILNSATTSEQMRETLEKLKPTHSGYAQLKSELARMRRIANQGGWPQLEGKKTLRPGDTNKKVAALRKRLKISGHYQEQKPPEKPNLYDDSMVAAVKHFQQSHGLKPDGVIGKNTYTAMNVSAGQRVRQIELNMERWRWLPRELGNRYIIVNTAAFDLKVVDKNQVKLQMKVVVGRPARRSPVLSSSMNYMVLNPYWHVPRTIAVEDILPKLTTSAEYLNKQHFKVFKGWDTKAVEVDPLSVNWAVYNTSNFPYRFRQDPGAKNALGQIKFMFPNEFAVYLHDTPQKSLFSQEQRDHSSGCIRLEDARALAAYLLADDPFWNSEKLNQVLKNGQRQVIHVPNPINIYLKYMTAWVDENKILQFRQDIYDHDRDLNKALIQRPPYPLPPLGP